MPDDTDYNRVLRELAHNDNFTFTYLLRALPTTCLCCQNRDYCIFNDGADAYLCYHCTEHTGEC